MTPAPAEWRPGAEVVVLEHQPDAPAGLVGEWMSDREIPWRAVTHDDRPPAPETVAAFISLGSSHSAYAVEPAWIADHVGLLRAALALTTPVLGICFGSQALAMAAGGQVARAIRPEVGWVAPGSERAELRGPWLAWHFDAITLPAAAVELAHTADAVQAYVVGSGVGLQFHPEVTPAIWEAWATREVEEHRRYAGELAVLLAEIESGAVALRERVYTLLDAWWTTPAFGMSN
jgi:GMP synthase-like glutamine amidotransferase